MSNVTIENIVKYVNDRPIIKKFNLQVNEGEFIVLIGPSGAGKSTILRAIAGLESIDEGRILAGNNVFDDPEKRIFVPPHLRKLGLVFQSYALWPHMNVFSNVAYPLKARRIINSKIPDLVKRALKQVSLEDVAQRNIQELSGGQQQRVAVARAIVAQPQILLLDEPLSNLDPQLRINLRTEIRRIHNELGRTTIHVTHDPTEALALADRIVVLRDGYIEQIGTPFEVYNYPKSQFVAEFFGYSNFLDGYITEIYDHFAIVKSKNWNIPILSSIAPSFQAKVNDEVKIGIKKNKISIIKLPTKIKIGGFGRVLVNEFHGDRREYLLMLENGIKMSVKTVSSFNIPIGTSVGINLHEKSSFIINKNIF